MIGTDYIFGRKYTPSEPPIGGNDHIGLTGVLWAFSFRQLFASSTLCLRQYAANDVTSVFQDVGFVNGYLDTNSIVGFANGTDTFFEWYDQMDNVLKYKKNGFSLPRITAAGALNIENNCVTVNYNPFGLTIYNISNMPTNLITCQVGASVHGVQAMWNSNSSGRWLGVTLDGQAGLAHNNGTPTYWRNGLQIGSTRNDLADNLQLNKPIQYTARNHTGFNNNNNIIKGYNADGQYRPYNRSMEEIWLDTALVTVADIQALEQNQINFYQTLL